MAENDERTYQLKNLTADQFKAELDAVWNQIQSDPKTQEQALLAGLTKDELNEILGKPRTGFIRVREGTAGLAGADILIHFLIAVGAGVFDRFILQRIQIGRSEDSIKRVDKK